MTTRSPTARLVTSAPDLAHDSHRFVAEDVARVHEGAEHLVQVQVGPADVGRRDLDDGVGRLFDLRIGNGVDP